MRCYLAIFCLLSIAAKSPAAEPLPGHSSHGEAFNEGPRQAAVLMDGCGKVHFPISSSHAEAQAFFNQGLGQLHGFWYYEAERSFRQVIMLDPECAMAYWGCAMANVNNETRAKGFIQEAKKRIDKSSTREKAWIEALHHFYTTTYKDKKERHLKFIKALETIVHENPEDVEAKAFLTWAIWKAKDADLPIVSHEAVDALLTQIFSKAPNHPAHHYRIHLWDDDKASRALGSAALCGQSSPAIAHMWHMPGHAYSKTGRIKDSEWQQQAAHRVDNAYIKKTRVLPDQIHNYAHNIEWLIRTHQQMGQADQAIRLAKNMIEMPRHPSGNTIEKNNTNAAYGRTRLLETLLLFEQWEQVLELDGSPLLDITRNPAYEATRLRAMGVAAYFLNNKAKLNQYTALLKSLVKTNPKKKDEKKTPGHVQALNELTVLQSILNGEKGKEITSKLKEDEIPKERLVRYHLKLGNQEQAIKLANALTADHAAMQTVRLDILMAYGKNDEAKPVFEKIRKTAAHMDATLPMNVRLDALAKEFNIPLPWRITEEAKNDTGVRPELDSLGPLYWQPVKSTETFARPTIVIFYLSGECSHCMEQLKKFQANTDGFKKLGVDLIAIGNESAEQQLNLTQKTIGNGKPLAIQLQADPALARFKAWRCHDDFEAQALHGVFLVDDKGFIRWQDISYTPFDNTSFLLTEAKRLLALPVQ